MGELTILVGMVGSLRLDDAVESVPLERTIRHEIAVLYTNWRELWGHSLDFRILVKRADSSEVVLQMEVHHFGCGRVFPEALRQLAEVVTRHTACAYLLISDPRGGYYGACVVKPGSPEENSVLWSSECSDKRALRNSAVSVLPEVIGEKIVAGMSEQPSPFDMQNESPYLYPSKIRRRAAIGFALVFGGVLLSLLMCFLDREAGIAFAAPAFCMAFGLFILQSVVAELRRAPNNIAPC